MKKQLIAIAAALSIGGGAHAQSTVQVSGLLDAYVGSMRMAGDAGRTNVVGSGGLTTSWIGFSGSEDLGGGLKANFFLTSFLRDDTGQTGRFTNDPMWSRDANVGLSGGFGTVTLGRAKAPNFLPTILFNPFGDSFTFSPLVLHANVGLFNGTGWGATTPSDTGWGNEVIYTTPAFGGLVANVHYQFGEVVKTGGASDKHNLGANFLFSSGPFGLTGFYERDQVANPVQSILPETKEDWMLGGSYDVGFVKGFLTYGQTKTKITDVKQKTATVGASAPIGAGKLLVAYANTKRTSDLLADAKRNTVSVGYDYFLSKRTDLYAVVMYDKITSYDSGTSFGLGVRHRF
jgi:predicted porin